MASVLSLSLSTLSFLFFSLLSSFSLHEDLRLMQNSHSLRQPSLSPSLIPLFSSLFLLALQKCFIFKGPPLPRVLKVLPLPVRLPFFPPILASSLYSRGLGADDLGCLLVLVLTPTSPTGGKLVCVCVCVCVREREYVCKRESVCAGDRLCV